MKILLVNTVPTEKNGITNVIYNYYRAINKQDLHIDLVTVNVPEASYRDEFFQNGGHIYTLERKMRHPLHYIRCLSELARGYDILHAHGNSATMVLEMYAAKKAGVPVRIAHSHNSNCKYHIVDKLCRIPFYAFCNVRLACSSEAGYWLFKNKTFEILNNGIDTDKFHFEESKRLFIREKLGWMGCRVIGHVGNFWEVKNHVFIIDIFQQLFLRDASFRLLLLGKGEKMEEMKDRITRMQLSDKVYFAGATDDVNDYLCAMDIIVMPSLHEGLPLTLIEEQANGLPCIVSDVITREADKTGLLEFQSLQTTASAWADRVCEIVLSEAERGEQSVQAIESIRQCGFDICGQADRLKEFYKSLLK